MAQAQKGQWLTVIVAAWNTAEWIEQTLSSMLSQVDHGVKVLIINDGSTDNTLECIEGCLNNYPDVKNQVEVISQNNRGISAVRNRAIRMVTTPWVTFLDGDDFWSEQYYRVVKQMVDEGDFDLIEFNAFSFQVDDQGNQSNHPVTYNALGNYQGELQESHFRTIFTTSKWYLWSRIFRTSLFDGLVFPEGKRYEDLMVTPFAVLRARRINATEKALIHYRRNLQSISTNIDSTDTHHVAEHIRCYLEAAEQEADPVKRKMLVLLAAQTMLFYKICVNLTYGYVGSIVPLKAMRQKVTPYLKRCQVQLPKKTRLLFISPAVSNMYTWVKTRRAF
ncbi:Glycosyltransferase involved in cell wall bisynthesis [Kushneria avicenniae]|uniref:Glycosyltransferase involved in cell wall bisynthesis n=1 Tax=Kushneria avicenniae TaxID=402385 RepID=A0A1I1MT94_9GAMM|nr:glycosyltransferase family 2 protein [Kushneria avicenniae]SFC85813.1 Glycosyltransferase involved in cell wall bisynthesis [Kushneria avicenniae]